MEKIFLSEKQIKKIIAKKRGLERELNVRLIFSKDNISVSGDAIIEYSAVQVINALALGFDMKTALFLQQEDYMLEIIHIKEYIKSSSPARLKQVKARIIGKKGKALKTISQLSDCVVKLSNSTLAIIGRTDDVKMAEKVLLSLIRGSKHSNIYARLERLEHKELGEEDLGLKEYRKD